MKRYLFLFIVMALPLIAAPKKTTDASQPARATATDLFKQGKTAEAVAHLRADLQPDVGPDGTTTALVQGLVEIANTFYNQRQTALARQVAQQAIAAADSIVKGH